MHMWEIGILARGDQDAEALQAQVLSSINTSYHERSPTDANWREVWEQSMELFCMEAAQATGSTFHQEGKLLVFDFTGSYEANREALC